jgi:hypothetical protein
MAYRSVVHQLFLFFEDPLKSWRYITLDFRLEWPEGTYPPCKHRPAGCV